MRFRLGLSLLAWSRVAACAVAVGGLALQLAACAAGSAASPGAGGESGAGSGAAAGMAGVAQTKLTVQLFTSDEGRVIDPPLLNPRDVVNVVATLSPASEAPVRFALLDSGGATPLDATLVGTGADVTPVDGRATVTLVAASTPTTFGVRASALGYPTTTLDVSVRKTGLAKLTVSPRCPVCSGCAPATDPGCGGDPGRPVGEYVVSVWKDRGCDLPGSPPDDGTLTSMSATAPVSITVPAGIPLAVVLRAERLAWGCVALDQAVEGAENTAIVPMTNVPMTFDTSDLGVTLGLESFAPLASALVAPKQALLAAVLGKATDVVDALLDAMRKDASDPAAFGSTRGTEKWDGYVSEALGPAAPTAIRDPLTRWLDAGLANLQANPSLGLRLRGVAGQTGPTVSLTSVLGLTPARSGFSPSADGAPTWQASANDNVLIGFGLTFDPATLLLGAARAPALAELLGTNNLNEALANAVPCQTVAAALVAHGESSGNSIDGCDRRCTVKLCSQAIADLLTTIGTPATTPATLDVALTAAGTVGADAELVAFDGSWLGWLTRPGQGKAPNLMGPASASAYAK
jgi:hypothetical protein